MDKELKKYVHKKWGYTISEFVKIWTDYILSKSWNI